MKKWREIYWEVLVPFSFLLYLIATWLPAAPYLGDIDEDDILRFYWNSNDSNGASITRATNGTISVYKDDDITQTTTGVTDTEDVDGLTGVHGVKIDTSAAAYYVAGADYMVVLSAATIDGQTVNAVLAHFSIENRSPLRPTTAARTVDVTAAGEVGLDLDNTVGTLDAAEIGTDAITAAKIAADSIGASEIATDAIGSDELAADSIGASEIATNAITSAEIAAAAIGADEIAPNAIGASEIATAAIDADAIGTDAIGADEIAADAISASELGASAVDEIWDETIAGHTLINSFARRLAGIRSGNAQGGAAGSLTLDVTASSSDDFYNNTMIVLIGGTGANQSRIVEDYDGTTKVATVSPNWVTTPDGTTDFDIIPFDDIPGASAPSAASIADAVWDEDATAHQGQGAFGQVIGDSAADADTIWALANTNLDAAITTRLAPTVGGRTLDVTATGEAGLDLDNTAGTLDAAEIGADAITAAKIAADSIGASEIADGAFDAATYAADSGLAPIRSGIAQAGAAGSITLDASASTTNDIYSGHTIYITAGTGAGQARNCIGYTGATKIATVVPNWTTNPASGTTFAVLPSGSANLAAWRRTVPNTLNGARVDSYVGSMAGSVLTATAIATDAITAAKIAADAIGASEIGTDAITATKIAADAIGASEIAADAIGASEIATDAIDADAVAADAIGASEIATAAIVKGTEATGWNDLSAAQVNSEVDTALTDIHLDHAFAVDYDPATPPGVATALWNELIESDAGVSRYTTGALSNAPGGGGGGDATAANQTTILNRLGAWTGTGDNTLLGAVQAITRSDFAEPSDIGGTFDAATDSIQAIRDRGDAEWATGSGTGMTPVASGTAQAGAAGTITLAAGEPATDDLFNGMRILSTGGTGSKQANFITDYDGTTKVATVIRDWLVTPDGTTTYEIQAADVRASGGNSFGPGLTQYTYTLTSGAGGAPIPNATIKATTDVGGTIVIGVQVTDSNGDAVFWLDTGTVYFWRQHSGFSFVNPDTEVVP